ncbi:MAG: hypothetical protein Q4A21_01290 [bacterium]|nr:hypothetical protein [bacterium]
MAQPKEHSFTDQEFRVLTENVSQEGLKSATVKLRQLFCDGFVGTVSRRAEDNLSDVHSFIDTVARPDINENFDKDMSFSAKLCEEALDKINIDYISVDNAIIISSKECKAVIFIASFGIFESSDVGRIGIGSPEVMAEKMMVKELSSVFIKEMNGRRADA